MSFDFISSQAIFRVNPSHARCRYPVDFKSILNHSAADEALSQISSWNGYKPTPLVRLSPIADRLGISQLYYKQEAGRFGLGSFKALGGAYAVFRLLAGRIKDKTGDTPCAPELISGKYADIVSKLTVTTATDGNHGRSVAWGASLFGCKSVIFVHAAVSQSRAEAIAGFGAKVIRTKGTYDDCVHAADRQAGENGWSIVSDTSYPGYIDVPRNVMQGYSVMVEEALRQLDGVRPSHVFLQCGVGGMAAAVIAHLWERYGENNPVAVIVEPLTAACLLASSKAGKAETVGGSLNTIMAGLACGEPSLIAWPILERGASAFMAIPDDAVVRTMKLLASGEAGARLVGGESGVAGLAGLLVLATNKDWCKEIDLNENSHVLIIGSEGDTDPELYKNIVGQSSAEVENRL